MRAMGDGWGEGVRGGFFLVWSVSAFCGGGWDGCGAAERGRGTPMGLGEWLGKSPGGMLGPGLEEPRGMLGLGLEKPRGMLGPGLEEPRATLGPGLYGCGLLGAGWVERGGGTTNAVRSGWVIRACPGCL